MSETRARQLWSGGMILAPNCPSDARARFKLHMHCQKRYKTGWKHLLESQASPVWEESNAES